MATSVDLANPTTFVDGIPHAYFRHLRGTDPVSWQAEPQQRGFWAITRYHDVRAVLDEVRERCQFLKILGSYPAA